MFSEVKIALKMFARALKLGGIQVRAEDLFEEGFSVSCSGKLIENDDLQR